jgi:hypothetical protein
MTDEIEKLKQQIDALTTGLTYLEIAFAVALYFCGLNFLAGLSAGATLAGALSRWSEKHG